jgi:CheY-like chemotaxis protein
MSSVDRELAKAQALVIDCNAASRNALAAILNGLGVGRVMQASRAQDGRRLLEKLHFDIVVCDYVFDGEPINGQDLMDDLRLAQLLPLSTVVIMISAEAGHSKVAEAAEAALDAYLLKPHTSEALRKRLLEARERKRALRDVFALIENNEFLAAAKACQVRFESRGPAWLHAARIAAELWLRLGMPNEAQIMFDAILKVGAIPWARLGIARSQQDSGHLGQARRTLETLLNEQPGYTDAYDVMSRVLLGQGLPDQALMACREAAARTPGSVARTVKLGLMAFYHGDPGEARQALSDAVRLGLNSKSFDLQGLVLLAFLQFDAGDARGLKQSWRGISAALAGAPESSRLRGFQLVLAALKLLIDRKVADSIEQTRQLISQCREPTFDFEAACNTLAVLARMTRDELHMSNADDDVRMLALRFAVSRTSCEFLVRASLADAALAPVIRDAYAEICREAEEAISKTIAKQPYEAVALLLASAERTLNGKLMDLATHTLDLHATEIREVGALRDRARSINQRYRSYGTQIVLDVGGGLRTLTSLTKA